MKLIFSSPTYGTIEPEALKSQRLAIAHAAVNGHEFVGDASPDKQKFDVARGQIAKAAIDSEADAVFWCDSDIVLPTHAITQLANSGLDLLTGIYFQKAGDHWPLIARFDDQSGHFSWMVSWPENVCAPIDGCGFGCVLTSTKMLRAIQKADPEKENPWFEYSKFSEDFDFCLRAKAAGFQLYVDTGVLCGHLPVPKAVTIEDFKKKHPEFFGGSNGDIARKQVGEARVPEKQRPEGRLQDVPPAPLELCEIRPER